MEYAKLRALIIEKYGTISNFCNQTGRNTTAVSLKLNGKTGFTVEDVDSWANDLGIAREQYHIYFFAPRV